MTRLASITAAVALAACGGSSEPKPRPLKYHFKEQHIAKVGVDQKKEMLDAQAEYNRAKQEKMKAEADYADSKTRLDVARNEAKQARLQKDSADSKKDAAVERQRLPMIWIQCQRLQQEVFGDDPFSRPQFCDAECHLHIGGHGVQLESAARCRDHFRLVGRAPPGILFG